MEQLSGKELRKLKNDKLKENVERVVRSYMERHGLKSFEMAHRCELTPGGLSRILKKERVPTATTLAGISRATGVSIPDLIRSN